MKVFSIILFLVIGLKSAVAQNDFQTAFPDIPRIDVHAHPGGDLNSIQNYLKINEELQASSKIEISYWVNVGNRNALIEDTEEVSKASGGKMISGIGVYDPQVLIEEDFPQGVEFLKAKGFSGYKIWFGPLERRMSANADLEFVDDERLKPFFTSLAENNVPLLSLHVADPNGVFGDRTKWAEDPVAYWAQIRGFENMLKKNPELTVLTAHGAWLVCQDAQLDYLRYLFSTYPNMYVDLAATFQYMNRVNTENLRDLLINFSDRILFGTDIGMVADGDIEAFRDRYARCFQILETDDIVAGGFFNDTPTQGLALPREALENIYYKNAKRIIPALN